MLVALEIGGVAVIALVLFYMRLFDRLVRWEYQHHREQWERDGKPDGFFWRVASQRNGSMPNGCLKLPLGQRKLTSAVFGFCNDASFVPLAFWPSWLCSQRYCSTFLPIVEDN
jgi:hypothetical protein